LDSGRCNAGAAGAPLKMHDIAYRQFLARNRRRIRGIMREQVM
jgi:hypothetical protein